MPMDAGAPRSKLLLTVKCDINREANMQSNTLLGAKNPKWDLKSLNVVSVKLYTHIKLQSNMTSAKKP